MGNNDVITWSGGQLDFSDGCVVMGVLNVTPDSFSDGGKFFDTNKAIGRGIKMAQEGAAIIDVGGESSRPGAEPVSTKEQIRRVVSVIEGLTYELTVPISIDTYDAEVAKAALQAGASMINDITALTDEGMVKLAAEAEIPVVLMHMQGQPGTMQVEPRYEDVVEEVLTFLIERAKRAEQSGIPKEHVFIDPGIGFGKKLEHNLELLRNLERFVDTGYHVLIGTSRKSFIGTLTDKENPAERVFGTAATVAHCAAKDVSIVRVHDVVQMIEVVRVVNALTRNL